MKAAIIVTGSGPILVLTSYQSFTDPKFAEKLRAKGIKKYLGYEVPLELCKQRYGEHYAVVLQDLRQTDDLRVLDFDGHHVLLTFSLNELGQAFSYEGKEPLEKPGPVPPEEPGGPVPPRTTPEPGRTAKGE